MSNKKASRGDRDARPRFNKYEKKLWRQTQYRVLRGSYRDLLRHLAMAGDALDAHAGTCHSCLRHRTLVPTFRWDPGRTPSPGSREGPRYKTRERFSLSRYMCVTLLVNLRRLAHRAGKSRADQMSRALRLPATTHLGSTSGKHLFDLEPTLYPLLKLTIIHSHACLLQSQHASVRRSCSCASEA